MEFYNNIYYDNIINDSDEEFDAKYIYKVVINKTKKLYFLDESETHPYFNLNNTKIYYIKVNSSSSEYKQAYNKQNNEKLSKY